jgi:hypothetical protein
MKKMKYSPGELVVAWNGGQQQTLGYITKVCGEYPNAYGAYGYMVHFFEEDRDDVDYFYDDFIIEKLILDVPKVKV